MIILPRANTRLATNVAINVVRKRKSKRKIEKKKKELFPFLITKLCLSSLFCVVLCTYSSSHFLFYTRLVKS